MIDLATVSLFLKVVELRGVAPAARALDQPRSTLSRRMSALEDELGAVLFLRSTRSFGLTQAGDLVHAEFCKIAEAQRAIQAGLASDGPRGTVRITAPFNLAMTMIAPTLPAFFAENRGLCLSFSLEIKRTDLIGEGFDVAIRAGRMQDTALIGRRLGEGRHVICASPAYLAANSPIIEPDDLAKHSILAFDPKIEQPRSWTLTRSDDRRTIAFTPTLSANDHSILLNAAIGGVGVTCVPERSARDAFGAGHLVRCLEHWDAGKSEVYALYPSKRALGAGARAFIDHLAATLDF